MQLRAYSRDSVLRDRPHDTAAGRPAKHSPRSLPFGEIWRGLWSGATWDRLSVVRVIASFGLLFACSWGGIVLSSHSDGVATIWLSNGILFGLLITRPPREWLAYFLVGLCADTSADIVHGDSFHVAIGVSLANSVEVVTSTLVLSRVFGIPFEIFKLRHLIGFLLVAVGGAALLCSILGAAWTVAFVSPGSFFQMLRTWYLGDMLGLALLAPLVIMLQRPGLLHIFQRERLPRTLLLLLIPASIALLVFNDSHDSLIFFLFPALLLIVFLLGFSGTVFTILLIAIEAIALTVTGHGPLMMVAGEHMLLHRIVVVQILLAVMVFSNFPVATLLEEREALRASLAESEQRQRQLALADSLTGLGNRRSFNLQLERAWAEALHSAQPLSLLMVDADFFKSFNDLYGHLAGDECLVTIARILAAVADQVGTPSRFGGEEFAVLLPGRSQQQAFVIASGICSAVSRVRVTHGGSPAGVQTVSVGVATLTPGPETESRDLVRAADRALYQAKKLGRNQVAHA